MPNAQDIISIVEKSYSPSELPKLFRVIFYLKDAAPDLAKGLMPGMKGISSTKEIVMQFLGVGRDAMLVMPAKETESLNKLSRVLYDNPQYLLQDNMAALARLYNARPGDYNIIQNLFGRIIKEVWEKNSKYKSVAYDAEYFGWESRMAYIFKSEFPKINGSRDLAKWTVKALKVLWKENPDIQYRMKGLMEFTVKDMEGFILEALKYIDQVYKSEGEWSIKDTVLKIPKGSRLFILKSNASVSIMGFMSDVKSGKIIIPPDVKDDDRYEWYTKNNSPQVELVKEYKLDKRYKVTYLHAAEFNKIQKAYFAKKYPG